jgi:hypothetical protein
MDEASMTTSAHETVTLRGGVNVPLPALMLLLRLEDRGCTFTVDGDRLMVRPGRHGLTDEDCAGLRRWKPQVIALIGYVGCLPTRRR